VTPGRAAADWYVCTGPLPPRGNGQKVIGPFATQELALNVRTYVEKAERRSDLWVDDEAKQPQDAPGLDADADLETLADTRIQVGVLQDQLAKIRELLDEIGVMAANAPEDGDSFAVCEEITMRIAAAEVEPLPERKPDRGDVLGKRFFHLASELENEAAHSYSREAAEARRVAAQRIRKALDTEPS
jgi:hypothetical protein